MHASGVLTRCHTREVPNLIPRSPRVELVRGRGVHTHPWLLGQPDGLSSAGVTTSTAGGCRRAGFAAGARWSTASSARPTGRRSSTWREHLTCRAGRWSAMRCPGGRGTAGRGLPAWVRCVHTDASGAGKRGPARGGADDDVGRRGVRRPRTGTLSSEKRCTGTGRTTPRCWARGAPRRRPRRDMS